MNSLRTWSAGFSRIPQYLPDLDFKSDQLAPSTIFKQIVILQIFYYVTATVSCYAVSVLLGLSFSFDWIFSWELVSLENSLGVYLVGMWLCDAFVCVLFMTVIVGRSKLAWDFALTIHCVDLVVVWCYTGKFPWSLVWWCVQSGSSIILVSLGTWTSRWRELRDTFFEGLNDAELGQARHAIEMTDATTTTEEN